MRLPQLVLFTTFLFIIACNKKSNLDDQFASGNFNKPLTLSKVIVSKPGAVISVLSSIDLQFNEQVIPSHLAGTNLDKSPFKFEPEIKGVAQWISQTQIRFTPEKPLKPGLSYKCTFKGKDAFGTKRNVDNFSFTFKTAEQEVIELTGDFEPDTSGINMVRYKGHIILAQPVNLDKLKKDLAFKHKNGKKVSFTLSQSSENSSKYFIISDQLKRGEKLYSLEFTLPSTYTVGSKNWSTTIVLPEANIFKVLGEMEFRNDNGTQGTYGFRFSDPIKTNANLSGYISIEPSVNYRLSIDKKFLKITGNFNIGQEYTITIRQGFPSSYGTKLSNDYVSNFALSNIKPKLEWLSSGIYLPSDNNFHLQFKSVNVQNLRCRITQVYENNIGFFIQNNILQDKSSEQNESDYYGSSSFYDLNRVGSIIADTMLTISSSKNTWIKSDIDLSKVFRNKKNAFFVVEMEFSQNDLCGVCTNDKASISDNSLYFEDDNYYTNPCSYGYYFQKGKLQKLLIASDIALTVKEALDGYHVYATNVLKAQPLQGLALTLNTYQNQVIQKQVTNQNGYAKFAKSSKAFYFKGQHASGLALMRVDHVPWDLSSYEISGVDNQNSNLNVFMYTDRGIHRPGDTVHLSAIVRSGKSTLPFELIAKLKVYNPQDVIILEKSTSLGNNGHVYFPITTDISDPTGNYRAVIDIANELFTKELKIETVKPNRLKVNILLPDTGEPGQNVINGSIESKYLFGTPAANLQTKIHATLFSLPISFKNFRDFSFNDVENRFTQQDVEIFDGSLDENGKLDFSEELDIQNATEMIQVSLRADVYEKGGSFTSQSKRSVLSPYSSYVGYKNPFLYNGAQIGTNYRLPLVVCNSKGKPLANHEITIEWFVNKDYWWWDYDNRSNPEFRSLKTTYKISENTIISSERPTFFNLNVEDGGLHFVSITDKSSGHKSSFYFYASEWGSAAQNEKKERPLLSIQSDKNSYYTDDKIVLSCETPSNGSVLLTIEQGSRILYQEMKPIKQKRTTFTVPVTKEMVPNCYAVMSLMQPHGQTSNDIPMRIYGVKQLLVEDFSTKLNLQLTMPNEIKPNQSFNVQITSKSKRKTSATIAIVDEGLLDLTGFETPDPWKFFFQRLRLGVLTRDNFEEVLGILFPRVDRHFSIGGDMDQARKRAGESKIQRFKPVVLFQKPITINPNETKSIQFKMPNYVGSVRAMVIGTAENSYASIEKTVPVRQPLMILTTIPRAAKPMDQFAIPVSVFSGDPSIRSVKVTLKPNPSFKINGESFAEVEFTKPGEKEVFFDVTIGQKIGNAEFTIEATSGKHSSFDKVELPILAPNPFYIKATDTTLSPNETATFTPIPIGIEGTNKAYFSFTRFPDIQLQKRYKDLIHYPYGCIEQTVSSVFPQLYIGSLVELTEVEKKMIPNNINAGIDRLSSFKYNGGFSYWPMSGYYQGEFSEWGTLYATNFLIEARKAGYHVPDDLYNQGLDHAENNAKNVNTRNHRYQCYRLYLLALAQKANQGAMNLVRENYLQGLDPLSKKFLATAYFLSGQKDAANQVDNTITTDIPQYREMSGTYGSSLRDQALMAHLSYQMGKTKVAQKILQSLVKEFKPYGWYSTQEQSFAILALVNIYAKSPMSGGAVPFTLSVDGNQSVNLLLKGYELKHDISKWYNKKIQITNKSGNPLFITKFEEGIPLENMIETEQKGIALSRTFYDDDGQPISPQSINQGEQFWIKFTVQSSTAQNLQEVALSSVLPAGWEIINPRLESTPPPQWVQNLEPSYGKFMDIRDDRVNWFFDLYDQPLTFVIKCNPTFKGTYRLPPVTVEPMYSPDFYARIAGNVTEVK